MGRPQQEESMASSDYHFISHWRVAGSIREVGAIIGDAVDLVRWWPSVYLDVREIKPGDQHGIGKEIDLYTKGLLPYTLRWRFRVTAIRPGEGLTLEAWGDFTGRGIWTFTQDGDWVDITYDWKIRANKPLLRWLSFLIKPIFAANHHWAMARGEESLKLELERRQAATPEEQARIPAPPGPTTSSPIPLLLAILGLAGLGAGLARLLRHWRAAA
jgi:hypothetical protein